MSAFYHVSSGRAYGPSEPGESLRDYKAHAKRFGFSSIGRELNFNGTNEILNFMGLTESEYNEHIENDEY